MLLSAIDKDLFDKYGLVKGVIEQVKFYINPQIYDAEYGENKYTRKNSEFERQSFIGKHTGKMVSSPMVQKALKKFYETKSGEVERVYINNGKIIKEGKMQSSEDNGVLG